MKFVLMSFLFWSVFLGVDSKVFAQPQKLFEKGAETFKIVDEHSKTPKFRILNSSPTKRSLAVGVNSMLNSGMHQYVDLELQKLILKPVKDHPDKVAMFLTVSGKEYYIEPNLKKSDLQTEKYIDIKVPTETNQITLFNVTSRANFTLKYEAKTDSLLIQNVRAEFEIENPMSANETEQIKFNGRGLRQLL